MKKLELRDVKSTLCLSLNNNLLQIGIESIGGNGDKSALLLYLSKKEALEVTNHMIKIVEKMKKEELENEK